MELGQQILYVNNMPDGLTKIYLIGFITYISETAICARIFPPVLETVEDGVIYDGLPFNLTVAAINPADTDALGELQFVS